MREELETTAEPVVVELTALGVYPGSRSNFTQSLIKVLSDCNLGCIIKGNGRRQQRGPVGTGRAGASLTLGLRVEGWQRRQWCWGGVGARRSVPHEAAAHAKILRHEGVPLCKKQTNQGNKTGGRLERGQPRPHRARAHLSHLTHGALCPAHPVPTTACTSFPSLPAPLTYPVSPGCQGDIEKNKAG